MRDGVSQGERAAPTAAEDVHLAVDIQLAPQPQHVADKMLGRIVGKGCRRVVVACAGRTLAAAALVKKNDLVSVGIEKASERLVTARSRPSMHDHDRLTVSGTVFFPVNLVFWMLLDSQMPRFVAGRALMPVCTHLVCHGGPVGFRLNTCASHVRFRRVSPVAGGSGEGHFT